MDLHKVTQSKRFKTFVALAWASALGLIIWANALTIKKHRKEINDRRDNQ